MIYRIALSFALAACFAQAAPPVQKTDPDSSQSELRAVIERYTADRGTLARTYPLESSAKRPARMTEFYGEWLGRLADLNFESLSPEGRIDYLLLRNHLQHEMRQLELQNKFREEEAPFLPFAPAILNLEEARRRMDPIDSPKAAEALNDLAKRVDRSREYADASLRSGNVKKSTANRAADTLQGL
ncbi:MAG TPA: hypothetical protein VIX89_13450, partial [Bryobacteraceae bacterium]